MPVTWKIRYYPNGLASPGTAVTKSLADWGISAAMFDEIALSADILRLVQDGAAIETDAQFAFEKHLLLIRDDGVTPVNWFLGVVAADPVREGAPDAERLSYEIYGLWYYLENRVFLQDWKSWDFSTHALVTFKPGRAVLSQNLDGTVKTVSEQLAEVIDFAIAAGAPIQRGTVDGNFKVVLDEITSMSCAEVIRRLCRWIPDAVPFFDYSTVDGSGNPKPTLHIRQRANCTAVSISVNAGLPNQNLDIRARQDLRVPAVVLNFEITGTDDGEEYTAYTTQKYPLAATGLELRAIVQAIPMQGANKTWQRQYVGTVAISADTATWWKTKTPWMKEAKYDNFVISNDARDPDSFPREIIEGSCPPWLASSADRVDVTADCQFDTLDADSNVVATTKKKLSATVTGTTLLGGTYSRLVSVTDGEPIPADLAQKIFEILDALQFEGEFVMAEEDCTGLLRLGKVLNLTDGRAEWESMKAQIQGVSFDLFAGTSRTVFGPAKHLSPQDFVELLRSLRNRNPPHRADERLTGQPSSGGTVDGGRRTDNENATATTVAAHGEVWTSGSGFTLTSVTAATPVVIDNGSVTVIDAYGHVIKNSTGKLKVKKGRYLCTLSGTIKRLGVDFPHADAIDYAHLTVVTMRGNVNGAQECKLSFSETLIGERNPASSSDTKYLDFADDDVVSAEFEASADGDYKITNYGLVLRRIGP